MPESASLAISNPFTQSWIQALTLAADHPLARTIKPKLELVDRLSKNLTDVDRQEAAQAMWDFAQSENLTDMLWLLPINQPTWVFDRDDIFMYERREADELGQRTYETWLGALGVVPGKFGLTAEVTSGDWAGLVRKEAVRLQHAVNVGAVQNASTLHLPCTAEWDMKKWAVRFEQVDWIAIPYEDAPMVGRPALSEIEDRLLLSVAEANDKVLSKKAVQSTVTAADQLWMGCSPLLAPLHREFHSQAHNFSPWMARVWNCAWPIVYREQNILAGKADVGHIRSELKACLHAQPRLTLWMLVFAKLVCQIQLGRGLGFLADYRD
jgi:hypothetical protein